MTTQARYQLARRRAKARMGFAIHLTVYGIINSIQMVESLFSSQPFAFLPGMLGWGLGLLIHGFAVFVKNTNLKDALLAQELERVGLSADDLPEVKHHEKTC